MTSGAIGQGRARAHTWVPVWDVFVRVAHWSVAVGFFVAFLTEEPLALHVWAGYVVAIFLAARIAWGFVGPTHARFGDFVVWPLTGFRYLAALVQGRAERHLGHSPAGALMVLALLVGLSAITATGFGLYAARDGAGPFSYFIDQAPRPAATTGGPPNRPQRRDDGEERGRSPEVRAWLELHEVAANLTFLLVLLHIAGVVLASFAHKENLVAAMFSGRKRAG